MWQSLESSEDYHGTISFIKKSHSSKSGGKAGIISTTYDDMPAMFSQDNKSRIRDENGNRLRGTAEMIVQSDWFTDLGITPNVDDFVKVDLIYYRIIDLTDYSKYLHSGTYHFTLRREEYVN